MSEKVQEKRDDQGRRDMSRMLEVSEGNAAMILRSATVHAGIGTQVLVATPDGTYVIDKVQVRANGSVVIRCKNM